MRSMTRKDNRALSSLHFSSQACGPFTARFMLGGGKGLGPAGGASALKASAPTSEAGGGGGSCSVCGGDTDLEASPPWDGMGAEAPGCRLRCLGRREEPGLTGSDTGRRGQGLGVESPLLIRHETPPVPALQTSSGGWAGKERHQ